MDSRTRTNCCDPDVPGSGGLMFADHGLIALNLVLLTGDNCHLDPSSTGQLARANRQANTFSLFAFIGILREIMITHCYPNISKAPINIVYWTSNIFFYAIIRKYSECICFHNIVIIFLLSKNLRCLYQKLWLFKFLQSYQQQNSVLKCREQWAQ